MAGHQVESTPFEGVSTAKQATFQVAPRYVRQLYARKQLSENQNHFRNSSRPLSVIAKRAVASF